MNILKKITKIPGALMLGPMLLGMLLNSLFPSGLNIGGFTTALFKTGGPTLMGVFLFCNGTRIRLKSIRKPLIKGSVFIIWKLVFGYGVILLVNAVFGFEGILGITPLALIPALTNTNSAMYIILTGKYGKKDDTISVIPLLLGEGPFITLIFLSFMAPAGASFIAILSMVIPLLIGVVIGNVSEKAGDFFSRGMEIIIPFLGLNAGAALKLLTMIEAGISGLCLGLFVVFVFCTSGYFLDRLFKGKRTVAGGALGTTAANSVMTPAMVAVVLPSFASYVQSATAQLAAAALISAVLCPIVLLLMQRHQEQIGLTAAQ